jgi:hypothetical protein
MSSLQDWQEEVIERHDRVRPYAPENGQSLKYDIGDAVLFTNDYGAVFAQRIVGFYRPSPITSLYATGARYYLDTDCHWMPVAESSLKQA